MISDEELSRWFPDAMRRLYWDGIAEVPWTLDERQMGEFLSHVKQRPTYPGHVIVHGDGKPRTWEESQALEVTTYDMETVVTAPHFFEWALDRKSVV